MGSRSRSGSQRDSRQQSAFERFVLESSTWLLRSAYLLTGDRSAAEDLLQLTLLRTVGRWGSAQQAPQAYARRVLVNLVRDRQRHATRRVAELPLEEALWTGRDAVSVDHAEAVSCRDEVINALSRLPGDQREVLVLRFYGDLSVAETAAATGTSQGTVKSRTVRALARMRELLIGRDPGSALPVPAPYEVADAD